MPSPKQHSVELMVLPKNLRYEILDGRLNHLIIVNVDLDKDKTKKLLVVLQKYHTV